TLLSNQLQWFDRAGNPLETIGMPAPYQALDLSRDGKRVVVYRSDAGAGPGLGGEGIRGNLWLFEGTRGVPGRFTFGPNARDSSPFWSPDGTQVAFSSLREGATDLYQKISNNAGREELLLKSSAHKFLTQWSTDGRFVYEQSGDLWLLPTTGDRKQVPLLQTKFNESDGQFSPDARWLAYTSNESGPSDVFVQPFPLTGAKWQVSTGGGTDPRWNPNGKEIFYISPDQKLMAATVRPNGPNIDVDPPKTLFPSRLFGGPGRGIAG